MISKELERAREYEAKESARVSEEERPVYHLSPLIGWLNDPNGFSFRDGKYHIFYQYHPYSTFWGPMHWGHAVSTDLVKWEYLPAALAPDTDYDGAGCFSGSALTLDDGRQLLMYTGCSPYGMDENGRWRQTQCIALSDGDEFVKYSDNPVIDDEELPDYGDIYEFRDPYLWKGRDGIYRSLVANASKAERSSAQLAVYRSSDGFSWKRSNILFEDFLRIGVMWECPNLFESDGSWILIASPMDMEKEEADGSIRFPKGNNVCYLVGDYEEETDRFSPYKKAGDIHAPYHPVDCGLDFYAPQIKIMPDGRRIMAGWMQDPKVANLHDDKVHNIFCQMTFPRELRLRDGKLIQKPVKELEAYRQDMVSYRDIRLDPCRGRDAGQPAAYIHETDGWISLDGINGRVADIEASFKPEDGFRELAIRFASDGTHYTELLFRPDRSELTVDRRRAGLFFRLTHENEEEELMTLMRTARVSDLGGGIDLRILLDRWSAEIFVNGGEQVMSVMYATDPSAEGIFFRSDGGVRADVTMYRLN